MSMSPSTLESSIDRSSATVRPSVTRPGSGRWILGVIAVALIAAGGAVGAVVGERAPTKYEASIAVEVNQVLAFESWESNTQTARFAQALLRSDLQEQAAAETGADAARISELQADREDGSPIVQITMNYDDPQVITALLEKLVDVTMADLVENDRAPQQLIVDDVQAPLAVARATEADLWKRADFAPGTDLASAYNNARFGLEAATAELETATEQWRIDQLPGIIEASRRDVEAIEPLLDEWYEIQNELDDLEARIDPAEDRLEDLALGLEVMSRGSHRSEVTVAESAASSNLRRAAAGGAAIGGAVALALVGLLRLRRGRLRE